MKQRNTLRATQGARALGKRLGLPCLVAIMFSSVMPVSAQFPRVKAKIQAKQQVNKQARQQAKQGIVGQKQLEQNLAAGAVLERFLQMTPQDRRRALARLAPARQRTILQRLGTLEALSDDERQQLRGRYQAFLDLPPDRQQVVKGELKDLRQMSRRERLNRLSSEELRQKFSENEIELMTGAMQ